MEELKPCPFCGSTKIKLMSKNGGTKYNGLDERLQRVTYSVRCNVCNARGGAIGGYICNAKNKPSIVVDETELINKAIEKWNNRCL